MDPFIGEIRLVPFNFAPRGWAICAGQLLPINQNQALFALLGTTYGGDGRTTFALPDLRGRIPIRRRPAPRRIELPARRDGRTGDGRAGDAPAPGTRPRRPREQRCQHDEEPGDGVPSWRRRVRCGAKRTYESGDDRPDGRRRGAREPAALSEPELHHCAPGDLPRAELTRCKKRE